MLLHVERIHDHHVGNALGVLAAGMVANEHRNPAIFSNRNVGLEDRYAPSFVFARMVVCLKSKSMPIRLSLADCFIQKMR